jgi:hypothetical protein
MASARQSLSTLVTEGYAKDRREGHHVESLFSVLDHLVYATPDLQTTVERLGTLFGVRPTIGGTHPAWGTMNALLALGPQMYLEIIGPDLAQPHPPERRPFNLDTLTHPHLATWVARGHNLPAVIEAARAERVDLGAICARSRQRPDGVWLTWSMTDLLTERESGLIPYFIHWGDTPHPAASAPKGCRLQQVHAIHPDAERLTRILQRLGLDLSVQPGPTAQLKAIIDTPNGLMHLH